MIFFDYIFIAIISFSILTGLIRGFNYEIISLFSFLFTLFLSKKHLSFFIHFFFKNLIINIVISIIFYFLIICLIIELVLNHVINLIFQEKKYQSFNRIFGAVFGLIRGIIISSLMSFFLINFTNLLTKQSFEQSRLIIKLHFFGKIFLILCKEIYKIFYCI